MEEQALYRAILSAPHDDTARLVYADWLDENAEQFPEPLARSERARAEFIRVQCALACLEPGGWKTGGPADHELVKRRQRLILQHGRKWRRAFTPSFASAPFDRGFLRPLRALRPSEVLSLASLDEPTNLRLLPLSSESPARRYVPGGSAFNVCPLWDLHLFASDLQYDPFSDHGQYAHLLSEVGRSPALERVGWLKLSFFHTLVFDFLRTGNFANVETLVLNSGPFPQVLEAVAENESFRSLRYILFGSDWWAWSGTAPMADRSIALLSKITEANARHLPYGEMRTALVRILGDLPPAAPPTPAPQRQLPTAPASASPTAAPRGKQDDRFPIFGLLCGVIVLAKLLLPGSGTPTTAPVLPVKYQYDPGKYKLPPSQPEPYRLEPLPSSDEFKQRFPTLYEVSKPPKTPAPTPQEKPPFMGPLPEK